jgi:hypothetical protein
MATLGFCKQPCIFIVHKRITVLGNRGRGLTNDAALRFEEFIDSLWTLLGFENYHAFLQVHTTWRRRFCTLQPMNFRSKLFKYAYHIVRVSCLAIKLHEGSRPDYYRKHSILNPRSQRAGLLYGCKFISNNLRYLRRLNLHCHHARARIHCHSPDLAMSASIDQYLRW